MTHPSYCCQKCGENIGYIGRFFQFLRIPLHRCKKPYKPKIVIDNSGASTCDKTFATLDLPMEYSVLENLCTAYKKRCEMGLK
jgi:hypothetical protein